MTLIRHGQSEANLSGHWQGHGDSPLSAEGQRQAERLAKRLARWERFDQVYSSDLRRASATALAYAERMGVSVIQDTRYREINVGRWEGLLRSEVAERFPDEVAALKNGRDVKVGGGESWRELAARASRGLRELVDSLEPGAHVALFAHGGFVASAVASLLAVSRESPTRLGHMSNTSATTLVFEADGKVRMERFNDTQHLSEFGSWAQGQQENQSVMVRLVPRGRCVPQSATSYRTTKASASAATFLDAPSTRLAIEVIRQRHAGEYIALYTEGSDHVATCEAILASSGILCPPAGSTLLVAGPDRLAVADYNVGDTDS